MLFLVQIKSGFTLLSFIVNNRCQAFIDFNIYTFLSEETEAKNSALLYPFFFLFILFGCSLILLGRHGSQKATDRVSFLSTPFDGGK